nr:uncharacterized protein LOC117280003 [Nicotiana tomentosiformis]
MAYTAVISLLQILEQRNPELIHAQTTKTIETLHATAKYFQKVLEEAGNSRFDHEKIKSLDEKIRVVASDAEHVVELKICQIIEGLSWTFGILQHEDLLPVIAKMDKTKKEVMEIVSDFSTSTHNADGDQILELSEDSLIGTSSRSYPMREYLEYDMVQGLDDDLETIVQK